MAIRIDSSFHHDIDINEQQYKLPVIHFIIDCYIRGYNSTNEGNLYFYKKKKKICVFISLFKNNQLNMLLFSSFPSWKKICLYTWQSKGCIFLFFHISYSNFKETYINYKKEIVSLALKLSFSSTSCSCHEFEWHLKLIVQRRIWLLDSAADCQVRRIWMKSDKNEWTRVDINWPLTNLKWQTIRLSLTFAWSQIHRTKLKCTKMNLNLKSVEMNRKSYLLKNKNSSKFYTYRLKINLELQSSNIIIHIFFFYTVQSNLIACLKSQFLFHVLVRCPTCSCAYLNHVIY